MRSGLIALFLACSACTPAAPREREARADSRPPPAPVDAGTVVPPARGERALWALQDGLAALRAPLRTSPRLPAGAPRPGVAPVEVRLAPALAWTARVHRCEPPHETDCAGGWEDGACECAVLVLEGGGERRALVLSESAALGRVRMSTLPRPGDAGAGLWIAADLYDRRTPWPRVGWLVEGAAEPVLAWRGAIGTCQFEVRGDPEEERAPSTCTAPEIAARYGSSDELIVELAAGTRIFPRAPDGRLTRP